MSNRNNGRRAFLKAAGISIALPTLESVSHRLHAADKNSAAKNSADKSPPMRMVCVGNQFGMYPKSFWPKKPGRDYEISPLLKPLAPHRDSFTLLENLGHGVKGGHFAIHTYLTGVKSAEASNAPDGGISLDQRAAEFVGSRTRFPSLTIGSETGIHGGCMMSWTRTGTRIPPIPGPRELFNRLFVEDSSAAKQQQLQRLDLHGSILDSVLGDAKDLSRKVNKTDRNKLDEYFTSVRDVESQLQLDRKWQQVAKPKVEMEEPENEGLTKDLPKVYDLIALALQTDATRVATLELGDSFAARDLGIKRGYHSLSHHGKVQASIELLLQIELYQMEQFARFVNKLQSIREPNSDGCLLDRTMALCGSGMGNANSHTNNSLPLILAGGGFRHGQHIRFPNGSQKIPLCNLYVTMLQRFGVETDRFSISTGTLTGLEQA